MFDDSLSHSARSVKGRGCGDLSSPEFRVGS